MTDSLEIHATVLITSKARIPFPLLLFRFLRLARTCLVWELACRQRDRTSDDINHTLASRSTSSRSLVEGICLFFHLLHGKVSDCWLDSAPYDIG